MGWWVVPTIRADLNVRDSQNRVIVNSEWRHVLETVILVDEDDPTLRLDGQVVWITEDGLAGVEVREWQHPSTLPTE